MPEILVATYIVLWLFTIMIAVAVLVCIRQLGEVYLVGSGLRGISGDGLDEGRRGADLQVTLADGAHATLSALLPNGGVVVFASAGCQVCKRLIPRLSLSGLGREVVVVLDSWPADWKADSTPDAPVVARFIDSKAPLGWRVRVTPFAFAVDVQLRVLSKGLVNTPEQIGYHLSRAVRHRELAISTHESLAIGYIPS